MPSALLASRDTHIEFSVREGWLEAGPDYGCRELEWAIDEMEAAGWVPMDGDEEPEDPVADGSVRIYFKREE